MAFWFSSSLTFQSHCSEVELYSGVALIVDIVTITQMELLHLWKGLQKIQESQDFSYFLTLYARKL